MKKLIMIVSAMLMITLLCMAAGAAEVVYLKNGGAGDGTSAASPVGSLEDAFAKLDLTKDCTVVICGEFAQGKTFLHTAKYTGSVTFTSVYGGVDYRKTAGAVYTPGATRYVCTGETIFRDMDFYLQSEYFLVIAAHNPLTIDEGVTMRSAAKGFNGKSVATGFSILGGYQNGMEITKNGKAAPTASDEPVSVTVKSGSNIVIIAYSRQIKEPAYSGKATISVEGNAQVGTLFFTPVNSTFSGNADVVLNIGGNAVIDSIVGGTNNGTVGSVTMNWESGEISYFARSNRESVTTTATNGYTLHYSKTAEQAAFFSTIAAKFDVVTDLVPAAPAASTEVILTIGSKTGYINGAAKTLDAAPIIRNDRTMLPVRFVAEAFGGTVGWDGTTSTVTIKAEGVDISITIGAATASINGKAVALDSPAFIESSRTYLPVRVVAEALGADVAWNGATSTATLTK